MTPSIQTTYLVVIKLDPNVYQMVTTLACFPTLAIAKRSLRKYTKYYNRDRSEFEIRALHLFPDTKHITPKGRRMC